MRAPQRRDPRTIEDAYQVHDDALVDWSPSVYGALPIPFMDARQITATEARMLDRLTFRKGLVGLHAFKSIADEAFDFANARYPDAAAPPAGVAAQIARAPAAERKGMLRAWQKNDGHNDAFRHAFWNAMLTQEYGEPWTREFTTAHEARPHNEKVREAMDLYNNEVGRGIGQANPRASRTELAQLVQNAVREGRMVVVGQDGHLAWSDQVPLGQHGIAPDGAAPAVMPVPRGNQSVR